MSDTDDLIRRAEDMANVIEYARAARVSPAFDGGLGGKFLPHGTTRRSRAVAPQVSRTGVLHELVERPHRHESAHEHPVIGVTHRPDRGCWR